MESHKSTKVSMDIMSIISIIIHAFDTNGNFLKHGLLSSLLSIFLLSFNFSSVTWDECVTEWF